jgi:exopolyphosphatase / guanosine-5'-triphosphate,3'-diphosphate pyrophosphatase
VLLALLMLLCAASPAVGATSPICVIDMGSNSFRRIVGSFDQGRYRQMGIEKRTLGVGDDVARHGRISDMKLRDIGQALTAFRDACTQNGINAVRAVGTAAFRDAANGSAVVQIARSLGIKMEIASEQRESELAYLVGSLGRDGYAVIDNGSRSIELVTKTAGSLRYRVFDGGYRLAYEQYFATASDPSAAVAAFRDRLRGDASNAMFMKGKTKLIGVEFGEMAELLFEPAALEGRVLTMAAMQRKLRDITAGTPAAFNALRRRPDIDRALPRLVAAVTLTEAFGYSGIELTARELGVGLIIEAGLQPH